jgi:hypothetical protein
MGFRNVQIEGPHKMTQSLATFDYVPLDEKRLAPPFGSNRRKDRST